MPKTRLRPLASVALAAALLLLVPLSATAAPSETSASLIPASLADWLDWLAQLWPSTATAGQETTVDLNPDGAVSTPLGPGFFDPESAVTQPSGGDGEANPDLDPNG